MKDLLLSGLRIAEVVGADLIGEDRPVTDVQIDSRKCGVMSLFVPLRGENTDGHFYIEPALKAGSSLCFVNRNYFIEHKAFFDRLKKGYQASFLIVDDPLAALQSLALSHLRDLPGLTVVGITGSYGKTTTKEMLGAMLSECTSAAVSPGNLNSEIGLPLAALRIREHHRYAVFEMGINNPGEMDVLSSIARPRYAAITNVGMAHIGLLGSRQAIASEKRKIFKYIDQSGCGFLPEDDQFAEYLAQGCGGPVEYFGANCTPGFGGSEDLGLAGTGIVWKDQVVHVPLIGPYNLRNILCAVSMAVKLGVPDEAVVRGLEKTRPLFGRGEVLTGAVTVIQDCYNANTDSMVEAMDFVGSLPWTGRKILVLGSMKELGPETETEHRFIGRHAADSSVDAVFFYGDESAAAFDDAVAVRDEAGDTKHIEWTADFHELEVKVKGYVKPGDLLLLKASRGVELERLTTGLLA